MKKPFNIPLQAPPSTPSEGSSSPAPSTDSDPCFGFQLSYRLSLLPAAENMVDDQQSQTTGGSVVNPWTPRALPLPISATPIPFTPNAWTDTPLVHLAPTAGAPTFPLERIETDSPSIPSRPWNDTVPRPPRPAPANVARPHAALADIMHLSSVFGPPVRQVLPQARLRPGRPLNPWELRQWTNYRREQGSRVRLPPLLMPNVIELVDQLIAAVIEAGEVSLFAVPRMDEFTNQLLRLGVSRLGLFDPVAANTIRMVARERYRAQMTAPYLKGHYSGQSARGMLAMPQLPFPTLPAPIPQFLNARTPPPSPRYGQGDSPKRYDPNQPRQPGDIDCLQCEAHNFQHNRHCIRLHDGDCDSRCGQNRSSPPNNCKGPPLGEPGDWICPCQWNNEAQQYHQKIEWNWRRNTHCRWCHRLKHIRAYTRPFRNCFMPGFPSPIVPPTDGLPRPIGAERADRNSPATITTGQAAPLQGTADATQRVKQTTQTETVVLPRPSNFADLTPVRRPGDLARPVGNRGLLPAYQPRVRPIRRSNAVAESTSRAAVVEQVRSSRLSNNAEAGPSRLSNNAEGGPSRLSNNAEGGPSRLSTNAEAGPPSRDGRTSRLSFYSNPSEGGRKRE